MTLTLDDAPPGYGTGASIKTLHTLGPTGTNCETAARHWFAQQGRPTNVRLHATLEDAVEALIDEPGAALLGCIAFPAVHTLVFTNLHRLGLVDCFVMPTHKMVLAQRPDVGEPATISTHPAPQSLVPGQMIRGRRLVNSNAQAAVDCQAGLSDACITTNVAAEKHGLVMVT